MGYSRRFNDVRATHSQSNDRKGDLPVEQPTKFVLTLDKIGVD